MSIPGKSDKKRKRSNPGNRFDKETTTSDEKGPVPAGSKLRIGPDVVVAKYPHSEGAERFKRLKGILRRGADFPKQVVLVTSALPNEGKTLVALNLALAAAMDKQGKVLLVDADLRRPALHQFLRPEPEQGLVDVLTDSSKMEQCVARVASDHLHVLSAGTTPSNPVAALQSGEMEDLIQKARSAYKLVVLDTPPVMGLTDADTLGPLVDGALVVSRAKLCSPTLLGRAIEEITTTEVLGVVLNDKTFNLADVGRSGSRYYSKYYR